MLKTKKITTIMIIVFILISISSIAFAKSGKIKNVNLNPNTSSNMSNVSKNVANNVAGVIKIVGVAISIAVLMVIGIKFMMGSAEEKAEYKKTLIPYFAGAVLLFAASLIADKLYELAQNLF